MWAVAVGVAVAPPRPGGTAAAEGLPQSRRLRPRHGTDGQPAHVRAPRPAAMSEEPPASDCRPRVGRVPPRAARAAPGP
eukprot:CAMPEP_0206016268 /NCGR_PEP_ID=MMETSP1464-20131121/22357_1 /ASSEMBLY_ACC=CAM_ASM_001124 /TAXON_ID=119497 /ORGANISM="Exanthemachrysis gayraliae, Strain RCC1523" /LENGTH=78 /DNA_ID=CAMNT_0053390077 /DNA_START=187 /DNA_END=420 /DNA_ORIENTATION=-